MTRSDAPERVMGRRCLLPARSSASPPVPGAQCGWSWLRLRFFRPENIPGVRPQAEGAGPLYRPHFRSALCHIAFYLLAIALKTFPVGVAYAMWSGFGIFFISIIGFAVFGQKLDLAAIIGLAMIVGGILVINLLSNTATH